jgi:Tol biopolymer transport system component
MADWAPDGRRLAFVTYDKAAPKSLLTRIVSIDPATGRATGTTTLGLPQGVVSTETIAWSPDGATLAVESKGEGDRRALWLLEARGGAGRRLHEYASATFGGVDFTPDGRRLVFGALADGRMQIHALDLETRDVVQLTRDPDGAFLPQVSPDGRWVAATSIRHVRQVTRRPWP